jgi:gas vesicle protein
MENNDKRLKKEQLKEKSCEVVDDLNTAVKDASKKMVDAIVELTVGALSDVLDKCANKTKEKIKKGKDDEQNTIS